MISGYRVTIELGRIERNIMASEDSGISIAWFLVGAARKRLGGKRPPADERNLVPLAFNCYVIETGDHTVLIETGGGDKMDARAREGMKMPATLEPLPETIAKQGIDPERIDIV